MVIGPTLIILNKYILYELHFPYPMFLSGLGVLFSGVTAHILVNSGVVKLQKKETVEGIFWYKRVLPVGLAYAGTLALGNIVYLLLDVGLIQMLKSFVPVIIMTTSYLAGIEYPSKPIIISVLIISMGTAATCSYSPQLSILGLLVLLMAEVFEAIRLVLTQFLLQNLKFGVVEGQYVLSPASAFWLFFASFIFEFRLMYQTDAFDIIYANPLAFAAASSLGLCINFLSYYVIQATSSLTMKILGGIRNIFTIGVSVVRYGEVVDTREAIGYAIAFFGFLVYSATKAGYWTSSKPDSTFLSTSSYLSLSNVSVPPPDTSPTPSLKSDIASNESSDHKMRASSIRDLESGSPERLSGNGGNGLTKQRVAKNRDSLIINKSS